MNDFIFKSRSLNFFQSIFELCQAINKEFMIDDTAMATKQITSKLDMLEKIVKGKPNRFLRNRQQTETSIPDQSSTKDKKDENLSRSNQSTSSRKRYRIVVLFFRFTKALQSYIFL